MSSVLPEYCWWGFDKEREPPAHLKTKKQLAEIGLKPVKPVGVIHTPKYDLFLYNPRSKKSVAAKKPATPAQLAALAKGRATAKRNRFRRRWYTNQGERYRDYNSAIAKARKILAQKSQYVILDTETTGLGCDEVVQMGVINLEGAILLNSLVQPTISIPQEVIAIHGITDAMVNLAPTFPEIYPQLVKVLEGKQVLIYNADFDINILGYCCGLHQLKKLGLKKRSTCLMLLYSEYVGDWNYYYQDYTWVPLGGNHDAVGDCLATLGVLQKMAESELVNIKEKFNQAWSNCK